MELKLNVSNVLQAILLIEVITHMDDAEGHGFGILDAIRSK